MSEIEKLYKNAGVETNKYKLCCTGCEHIAKLELINGTPIKWVCDKYGEPADCDKAEPVYPPFTAEKQLELIKWLGELDLLEIIRTTRDTRDWIINSEYGMSGNVYKHASRAKIFEEALAKLINSLWQDLTEQEKEQIRDILKG